MSSYISQRNDSEVILIDHRVKKEAKAREHEKMKNAFRDKNAYESAGLWSKVFFSWTAPVL